MFKLIWSAIKERFGSMAVLGAFVLGLVIGFIHGRDHAIECATQALPTVTVSQPTKRLPLGPPAVQGTQCEKVILPKFIKSPPDFPEMIGTLANLMPGSGVVMGQHIRFNAILKNDTRPSHWQVKYSILPNGDLYYDELIRLSP